MKQLHKFLKAFIFVQLGACCGRVLARYMDFIKHPKLYEMQSAPWYTGVILTVILTVITVAITAVACFTVGHIIKKQSADKGGKNGIEKGEQIFKEF